MNTELLTPWIIIKIPYNNRLVLLHEDPGHPLQRPLLIFSKILRQSQDTVFTGSGIRPVKGHQTQTGFCVKMLKDKIEYPIQDFLKGKGRRGNMTDGIHDFQGPAPVTHPLGEDAGKEGRQEKEKDAPAKTNTSETPPKSMFTCPAALYRQVTYDTTAAAFKVAPLSTSSALAPAINKPICSRVIAAVSAVVTIRP